MMLTKQEQEAEMSYRRAERISILCEDRKPTIYQMFIAELESQEWLRRYLNEHQEQGVLL